MAEILTFEWDALADELKVGGMKFEKGTFRQDGAVIGGGGGMVVRNRGGGVFEVSVPAQYVPKKLKPVEPVVQPVAEPVATHTVAPATDTLAPEVETVKP